MKNGLDIYGPFSPVQELLHAVILTDSPFAETVEGPRMMNRWEIFSALWNEK